MKKTKVRLFSILLIVFITTNAIGTNSFANEINFELDDEEETGEVILDDSSEDSFVGIEGISQQIKEIESFSENEEKEENALSLLEDEQDLSEELEALTVSPQLDENCKNEKLTDGIYTYYLDEESFAHIVSCGEHDEDILVIPIKLHNHIVVSIEENALASLRGVKKVQIPFYVRYIDSLREGMIVQAYRGSYASYYATVNGYEFENLSEFDFADGVYDYSEILRSNYSFVSENVIEMNKLEGEVLVKGTVFYLPVTPESEFGDIFKVVDIEEGEKNVVLTCERALGAEALNTLVIHAENLEPDWDKAIYYFDTDGDGIDEEIEAEDLISKGEPIEFVSEDAMMAVYTVGGKFTSNIEKNLGPSHKDFLANGKTVEADCKLKFSYSTSISASLDADFDFSKCEVNQYELVIKADSTVKGTVGGYCNISQPIGKVPISGIPGIISAYAELTLNFDAKGEAYFSVSAVNKGGVKYADGEWTPIRENSGTVDINAEGVVDFYVQLSFKAYVLGLVEGSVYTKAGIECVIKGELLKKSATMDVYLFLTLGSKASLFKHSEYKAEWPAIKIKVKEVSLLSPRDGPITVKFVTGKESVQVPSATVDAGMTIKEPFVGKWADEAIIGWYKDAKYTTKWDFEKDTVTEDTTLYARWAKAYLVTYKYNINGVADYKKYVAAGDIVPKPAKPAVANYVQKGWYTNSMCTNAWSFASGTMPKRNLTLYGKYEEESGTGTGTVDDVLNEFTFKKNTDGTITVTGYNGDDADIVIPDYIYGNTVVDINANGIWSNKYNIQSITVPASITHKVDNFIDIFPNLETIIFEEGTIQILGEYQNANINKIIFPSSVKTISASFSGCNGISYLNIPANVTYVKSSAFEKCKGLREVYIGGNTVLGDYVFSYCENLKKATFGEGTDGISKGTFYRCSSLNEVIMPDSVETIGEEAFSGCSSLKNSNMSKSTTVIGEYAYASSGLVNVVLPDGVEQIGDGAFAYCNSLEKIVIPNSVMGYGEKIFQGSYALDDITLPCFDFDEKGKSGKAFNLFVSRESEIGCFDNLISFTLTGCDVISELAFEGFEDCTKAVNLPDYLTEIENYAFVRMTNLTSIDIPDSVRSIGIDAFSETGLTTVNIPRDIENISSGAFGATNIEYYTCSEGIKVIGGFEKCTKLTQINIPDSVTRIEDYAFCNCTSLSKVCIPANVLEIGKGVFGNCENIEEILIEEGTKTIGSYAFSGCSNLRKIVLPATLEEVGKYILRGCYLTEDITTPVFIYYNSANGSFFKDFFWDSTSKSGIKDSVNYTNLKRVTLVGTTSVCNGALKDWKSLEYVKISDSIMGEIGSGAFSGCTSLKQVIIPDEITYIGNGAFYGCTSLEEINIPEKVWGIDDSAFYRCSLKSIRLPSELKYLGEQAFSYNKELEEIIVPAGVEKIGRGVFGGCTGLKCLTIPTFDTELEDESGTIDRLFDMGRFDFEHTYEYPDSLDKIILSSSVNITSKAFSNLALKEVYIIKDGISVLGNPFMGCDSNLIIYAPLGSPFKELALENGFGFRDIRGVIAPVTFIDDARDINYTVYLPVGSKIEKPQESIDLYSEFEGWYLDRNYTERWNFDDDILPREGISLYAHRINEDDVTLAGGFLIRNYGEGVEIVSYVANDTWVDVPPVLRGKKVVKICKGAFENNESAFSISIPSTVEIMYAESFENVVHLRQMIIDEGNNYYCLYNGHVYSKDLKEFVLFMPSNVSTKFTVPDGVERIGDKAFWSTKLEEITIPNGVKSIGKMAFSNCMQLKVLYLGNTIESIDKFAIFGLDDLEIRVLDSNPVVDDYLDSCGMLYNRYQITCNVEGTEIINSKTQAGKLIEQNIANILKNLKQDDFYAGEWIDSSTGELFAIDSDLMPHRDLVLEGKWIRNHEYEETEGGMILTKVNGIKADCVVPEEIDGRVVVGIDKGTYTDSKVKSVTIPASVKSIEIGAINTKATIIADKDSDAYIFAQKNKLDFAVRKYTIEFETNGGSVCKALYLEKGSRISTPPVTVKDNYNFTGWYTDKECSKKWDFGLDYVTGQNIVLYAGWEKIDSQILDCQFSYDIESNETITITGYNGTESDIIIPSSINGMEVEKIAEGAMAYSKNITSVTIPDSVKEIGANAWAECENLNIVDLSKAINLTEIPSNCFLNDSYLYEVLLPNSITEIGNYAFACCTYLQGIEFNEGITKIGIGAFYNDKMIEKLSLPNTISEVDNTFVDGCTRLATITVDGDYYYDIDGVLYCGNELVRCPEGYKGEIAIPSTISIIGEEAFKNSLIKTLVIPDSVRYIKSDAFLNCKQLESVVFGDESTLSEIGDGAWAGCSSLEHLIIGKNVLKLGNDIFWGDKELTVRGYANSAIEEYAKLNKCKFEYIDDEVIKAMPPIVESAEYNTVVLKPIEGYEYQYDESEWQSSNVFANLQPYTEYTFYQRIKANGFHSEGERSDGTTITTDIAIGKTVRQPVVKEIRSTAIVLAPIEDAEYSIDGIAWQKEVLFDYLECDTEYTVCQRIAATENSKAGPISSINVKTLDYDGICHVSFDAGEGTFSNGEHILEKDYEHDALIKSLETPTRDRWEFVRWVYDDNTFYSKYAEGRSITITAEWRHERANSPIADKTSGTRWDCGETVTLQTESEGTTIYYTLDGSVPTAESERYTKPIVLNMATMTIKAIAIGEEYTDSLVVTFKYYTNMDYGTIASVDRNYYAAGAGFWVAGLKNMTFTGKAIKQNIRVYDENILLTENVDYTVKYASNTNVGKAKVTITGKGNYSGVKEVFFDVLPKSISESEFSSENIILDYNSKKTQSPAPILLQSGKKLVKNRDYVVEWTNENGELNKPCKNQGDYVITIRGIGNYQGERNITFTITDKINMSKVSVSTVKTVKYGEEKPDIKALYKNKPLDGNYYDIVWPSDYSSVGKKEVQIVGKGEFVGVKKVSYSVVGVALSKIKVSGFVSNMPYEKGVTLYRQNSVKLMDGTYELKSGEDYSVRYENNTAIGTATVIYTGMNKYTGEVKKTFAITGIDIKKALVSGVETNYLYTSTEIKPTVTLTYSDRKKDEPQKLVNNSDYTVNYTNNVKVGTATITITGKGLYYGTIKKTYKITPYNMLKDESGYITVSAPDEVKYIKGGNTPDITVTFKGKALVCGTDYTVTYATNKSVTKDSDKKKPTIVITGKGNFTGKMNPKEFIIVSRDISEMKIEANDVVYTGKAKKFITAVTVTDSNCEKTTKLTSGTDFEKIFEYTYFEDVNVTQIINRESVSVERKAGNKVDDLDIIPAGTMLNVKLIGKNNYYGEISATYRIVYKDIAKSKVKVDDMAYTGKAIVPEKSQIKVLFGEEVLDDSQYEIVDCINNIKKGTASLTIKGIGEYGGTKKINYKIVTKALE